MPKARKAAHIVSRAEMARRLRVTPSGVTRACRPGGRLHDACEGRGVNVLHDASRRWLAQREAVTQELPSLLEAPADAASPAAPATPQTAEEIQSELGPWRDKIDLESLVEPLTALTEKYGDHREFTKWIGARKALSQARREEMLQARVAGKLIARTTVERMISHVDVAFRLILSDAPRSIATRIAPENMAAVASIIRGAMEQILNAGRTHMLESLHADDPSSPLMEATAAE